MRLTFDGSGFALFWFAQSSHKGLFSICIRTKIMSLSWSLLSYSNDSQNIFPVYSHIEKLIVLILTMVKASKRTDLFAFALRYNLFL